MTNIELLRERAERGDRESQFGLGLHNHDSGIFPEALKWYGKAAERGHDFAHNNLGLIFQTGSGVAQDFHQAAYHFLLGTSNGLRHAQYNLGVLYLLGKGVHSAPEEGIRCLTLAADQHYCRAEFQLGDSFQSNSVSALVTDKGSGSHIAPALFIKLIPNNSRSIGRYTGGTTRGVIWQQWNLCPTSIPCQDHRNNSAAVGVLALSHRY
jgi:TPR repeat protein